MLSEITIKNVAVIEEASVMFNAGLNVMTGETGAGKSIVIDSINAILGNRTSRDIVRSGTPKAMIWARFEGIDLETRKELEDAGYEPEDELILQREVTLEGKSSCRINGSPATASVLRQIGSRLIQIHGQHDNQSLLNPAMHIGILDSYANNEAQLDQYRVVYGELRTVQKELQTLNMDEAHKARKMDMLAFEVEEIELAGLEAGEEEQLLERREVIRNAQGILNALGGAYDALSGGDETTGAIGAVQLLGASMNELGTVSGYGEELASFSEKAGELYYAADELASDLQRNLDGYDFDAGALDELESRLDLIYKLKQKYGGSVEEVVEYGARAKVELENIQSSDRRIADLDKRAIELTAAVKEAAEALTISRNEAFERLKKEISTALAFLNMPGIIMDLKNTQTAFSANGQNEIEFLISTNPGETPKSLAKIASGGELSRIMLAIKSALADRDDLATIIYDEIDTGISGMAAGRIGQMLQDTAQGRQVICVTHTAQIAAYAVNHLYIEKNVVDGRTFTAIHPLDEKARVEELARITSGDKITQTALANAREMMDAAQSDA